MLKFPDLPLLEVIAVPRSINQAINQSINTDSNTDTDQSINQSINTDTNTDQSIDQSIDWNIDRSINRSKLIGKKSGVYGAVMWNSQMDNGTKFEKKRVGLLVWIVVIMIAGNLFVCLGVMYFAYRLHVRSERRKISFPWKSAKLWPARKWWRNSPTTKRPSWSSAVRIPVRHQHTAPF